MYAVVAAQGHQYIVSEGDTVVVDQIDVQEGGEVVFDRVLCVFDEKGENVRVGGPVVDGVTISARVVCHEQGKKMRVMKFQSKKRYQKVAGFRAKQSVLAIEKINI